MITLEINSGAGFIETIEDLKFQRETIIETIKCYENANVKAVMTQMVSIISASNWNSIMDETSTDDLIELAVNDVARMQDVLSGNGGQNHNDMHLEASKRQLSSSMR